jgi:ENTS family enterobactin (siderophore) exporter
MKRTSRPGRRRNVVRFGERSRRLRSVLIDARPLRLDREFRLWWSGLSVTQIGNQITRMALRYQVYVLTGSLLAVALLTILQFAAAVVFATGVGSFVDAIDRRRLLFVAQAGMCGSSAALLVLATQDSPALAPILALAFVSGSLGAVDSVVRSSAIARLVPRERLTSAIALTQLSNKGAQIIGPAVGGIVIAAVGVAGAYAVDVATFAASFGALAAMKPIPPLVGAVRPGLAALREGVSFVRRGRLIMASLIIDLNATVFGVPTSLFPAMALDVFKVGPTGFGLLAAAPGFGAVLGALLSGWMASITRIGRAVIVAVAVWGLAIAAFGLVTFSFPLSLALLAIAGAADIVQSILRSSIVQHETPEAFRGRVTSVYQMGAMSGARLGDVEAALVGAAFGAQLSALSGGVLCLIGTAVVARLYPELARYVIADDEPSAPPRTAASTTPT